MKLKASKKEIKENSYKIIKIGYCDADYLLSCVEPFSYCCGLYGWSCDNYEVITNKNKIVISIGYAPIESKNINTKKVNYDLIRKYNQKALQITNNSKTWEERRKKINKLLFKFVDYVCEAD